METLMRSAAATRISVGKVMFMLMGFWGWSMVEGIHPLDGGYVRRKVRADRRPGQPAEPALTFYLCYAADLLLKHVKMAWMTARFLSLRYRIKRDPAAMAYLDAALTPVRDNEGLELFSATDAARTEVEKRRRLRAPAPT
jgi:hypothetical protein